MSEVGYSAADQDVPSSQSNAQLNAVCKVVVGRGHVSTVYPDNSAITGVSIDAPLTVKQHFQQQRKQQKSRTRENKRDTKKQTFLNSTATAVSIQATSTPKNEKMTRVGTNQQILHPARALSEPAYLSHSQSHQNRPSTSKSADQEILKNANMKVDPRLLGCFNAEDCGLLYGTVTSQESAANPMRMPLDTGDEPALELSLRNTFDSPMQPCDPLFRPSALKTSEEKSDDIQIRNEGVRHGFIQYPSNKCDNLLSSTLAVHSSDNSRLPNCGSVDFTNVYSSIDGLDMSSVHSDSGTVAINGTLEQSHTDADPTSFDQGVEKLYTETDERFLSWLYCENEHPEDDNAEYTRVLEEIEKDECYTHKVEDNQRPDFGTQACIPSTSHTDNSGKAELDFSHPMTSDCIMGDYASVPPTLHQRDALPDSYTMSDFDSDMDLDVMPIREDEETLYGRLLDVLVRDIKLLTYNNAALVDEVSRLNYAIFVASEERKVLARRSCHHDRNRIRRLQTANKRKSDAQRRQQEQLTIAETQENIAQIKAKMARTIACPQKVKPSVCGASSRPTLDVAAIKRSVEAEQRALEDKISLRKTSRKVGNSKLQRKRYERSRSERKRRYAQGSGVKRGRIEGEQREQVGVSPEDNSFMTSESMHPTRKLSRRWSASGSEAAADDQDRRTRRSVPMHLNRESGSVGTTEESGETMRCATLSVVEVRKMEDRKVHDGYTSAEQYAKFANDENEIVKNDQSQSWRRRAGRPPARAASAAAQTLLAAELAPSADTPTYTAKRTSRSRSDTIDAISYRPQRRRVVPQSQHVHDQQLEEPNRIAQLTVEVSDEGDLDLEPKYETFDGELTPLGDVIGSEDSSTKMAQPVRSRRSTRTSSRQSIGETGDGIDFTNQGPSSPSHIEAAERAERVSMATRSHGRANSSSFSPSERQMRERKQPTIYSPVSRSTPTPQLRVVKKKS